MYRLVLLFAALCAVVTASPALASERYALIVGNDAYEEVTTLQKAVADAMAMADQLSALGFDTQLAVDVGRRDFNVAIANFTRKLSPGDTAVVFYAGHGVEIDGENYLLPTDIIAPSTVQTGLISAEAIGLSSLLERIRATGARTTVAFVDACRDNPFAEKTGRSIGSSRGLGRIAAPEGTFVIYSAGAGQQALDRLNDADSDPNSVFTRNLLPKLSRPGLELRELVADLRVEVRDLARTQNHAQFPAYYDELLGEFFFTPTRGFEVVEETAPNEAQDNVLADNNGRIRADFELARQIGSPAALEAFIAQYEDSGDFAVTLARQMLAELQGSSQPKTEAVSVTTVSAKEIMRETQTQLNRVGCNAGGADGVAGRRTRSAFAKFITASGADLSAADLGTKKALSILQDAKAPTCEQASPVATETAPATQPAATGPSLAGTWSYRYSCALVVNGSGTVIYTKTGPNSYSGRATDNLGNTLTSNVTLDGLSFSGSERSSTGVSANIWGTLDASGNSYRSNNSFTCKANAVRVR